MHACGHDVHTANLVGVARILCELRDSWSGTIRLVFQPAEENGGGGREMIRAGILDDIPIDASIALHTMKMQKTNRKASQFGRILSRLCQNKAAVFGMEIEVSGNLIKNVKSVVVPNTGGLRGISAAAAAGVIAGHTDQILEVISQVSEAQKSAIADFISNCPMVLPESCHCRCESVWRS